MSPDNTVRPCCDDSSCPRADIVRLLSPDEPIENDVDELAFVVAHRCGFLDRNGLAFCFTRAFEMPTECQLFDRFCTRYSVEMQALSLARGDAPGSCDADTPSAGAVVMAMWKSAGSS
jgi:hypothetical protein